MRYAGQLDQAKQRATADAAAIKAATDAADGLRAQLAAAHAESKRLADELTTAQVSTALLCG